jgi:hypothetical protein
LYVVTDKALVELDDGLLRISEQLGNGRLRLRDIRELNGPVDVITMLPVSVEYVTLLFQVAYECTEASDRRELAKALVAGDISITGGLVGDAFVWASGGLATAKWLSKKERSRSVRRAAVARGQ